MQQRLRALHPKVLKIGQRRFAEHRFATALQRARACRQRAGGLLQREALLEMLTRPLLEALNERIGLRQMIWNNVGSLRGPNVGKQIAGDHCGQLWAAFAYQPEREIEMPHRRARSHMPKEVPHTLQLYLEGKIEQFWFREKFGPIFLMNAASVEEAKATLDTMPLVAANLMSYELMPVGPLVPLGRLIEGH
jgi:hypothetical protein